jgi:REP element-mobilizing transposase RayT
MAHVSQSSLPVYPRPIYPGSTYLITRRTVDRRFLLRPDAAVNRIVCYLLAYAAERYGIAVHAVCVMSNHVHLVATDPRGVLPDFLAYLHRMVALCLKVVRRWDGPFWDSEQPSMVRLETRNAVVEKIAYVIANPVASMLVGRASDWPGLTCAAADLGRRTWTAQRPKEFLRAQDERWPPWAELTLTLPPHVQEGQAEGFRQAVESELKMLERRAARHAVQCGTRPLGVERVCRIDPYQRAGRHVPKGGLKPLFATGRAAREDQQWVRAVMCGFRAAYREAFRLWRSGVRSVAFPFGTWYLRMRHGAACEMCAQLVA